MNLLGFIGRIFLPGEPLSSCQPRLPAPRLAPPASAFQTPCVCFVCESRLLSLVLRLGTHCACFHGHWEALSAMCFKGNLSPPSARTACLPQVATQCVAPLSQASDPRLPGGKPCVCRMRLCHLTEAPPAECMDVPRAGQHVGTPIPCALVDLDGCRDRRLVRVREPFRNRRKEQSLSPLK